MTREPPDPALPDGLAAALRRLFLGEVGLDEQAAGGRTLGPYLLLAPLGHGAGGTVWRALHRGLLHEMAVKTLDGAGEAIRQERFQREAATAARLRHPNIVHVHDFGSEGDTWYLAMDLVEGRPLQEWVAQAAPTLAQRLGVIEKIVRAVAYAHSHGVVHRDLKPGNVMVRDDGEPVLVDFGVARELDEAGAAARRGGVSGTYAFMAPEQLRGGGEDARTDLYALGVLLHWAVTGQLAFGDPRSPDAALATRAAVPAPPSQLDPTLPRALDVLVGRCLAADPAYRIQSAAALADDLRRVARGEPIEATATTPLARAWWRLRPHRWRVAAAAAAIVVAALAIVAAIDRLENRATVERQRRLLGMSTAMSDVAVRTRSLMERAELARYQASSAAERPALLAEIEAVLADFPDDTGTKSAFGAWARFMLAPEQAPAAFAQAKASFPDNPFVFLMSARRELRRAAESPVWAADAPLRAELLLEPAALTTALRADGVLRQSLRAARDDLDRARVAAHAEELPRMAWIGHLCAGLERFAAGDSEAAIRELDAIAERTRVDFEATVFLCLALCDRDRTADAVAQARTLVEARPGITPGAKLLALCLQLDAHAELTRGGTPVAALTEARDRFATARGDSLVDDLLAAQIELDLENARANEGTDSAAGWEQVVARWRALRDRIAGDAGRHDDGATRDATEKRLAAVTARAAARRDALAAHE